MADAVNATAGEVDTGRIVRRARMLRQVGRAATDEPMFSHGRGVGVT
jgi:hypothetical protein